MWNLCRTTRLTGSATRDRSTKLRPLLFLTLTFLMLDKGLLMKRRIAARTLAMAFPFSLLLAGAAAQAADISVLSAGAIEPGLKAAAAAFEKQTGHGVKISFNTAPELKK